MLIGGYAYLSDYYHANDLAVEAMAVQADGVQVEQDGSVTWFLPSHPTAGLIFYPGGKVEDTAYAAKYSDDYAGLILLAAYSTKDLTGTSLRVLSIYGSGDGVLNRDSYEKDRKNLPADFTEVVIDGGCHAQFGSYGAQKGDGTPTISDEEQIQQTATCISNFIDNPS